MNEKSKQEKQNRQLRFREFVEKEIIPFADSHDREEHVPDDLIKKIAQEGYLGATVPQAFGGMGMDLITFGLLNEEIGRACTSVRSLITVQSMVTQVIERWHNDQGKSKWLKKLASGETIAAFALTEPEYGSDAGNIQTTIDPNDSALIVNGQKKWITFGQIADVFLTFGQNRGKHCAVLIEKETPGLDIKSITGLLGARGSMLAELKFDHCRIPKDNLIGNIGFGLHPIAFTALDIGRYSIAWGCVGLAQACLEASIKYAKARKQFDDYISDYQMIQEKIANMIVDIKAARLLCVEAGRLKESGNRRSFREMLVAKYFTSNMAIRVANIAVEIHGANGYCRDFPVERFFRDAKIMETIEGYQSNASNHDRKIWIKGILRQNKFL